MHSIQLRSSPVANPWRALLALSVGAGIPSVFCRLSRAPCLQSSFSTFRAFSADPKATYQALPCAAESLFSQHGPSLTGISPSCTKLPATTSDTAAVESVSNDTAESQGRLAADVSSKDTSSSSGPVHDESSKGNVSSGQKGSHFEQLCFKAAAACIPHPAKVEKGGEDAYFIADNGLALGIADGVGSWAEIDIDAGIYSRMLMNNARNAAEHTEASSDASQTVLTTAYRQTDAKGSCTACVVILDGSTLRASNLGDSGFLVLRNNQIIFQSPTQQHQFNFPYQLGGPESRGDPPEAAERFSVGLQTGDVVVLATDGVIDNVYPQETASLLSVIQRRGDPPPIAAACLTQFAKFRAEDKEHLSPFAYGAQKAGYQYRGGKIDDITVVVAYVNAASGL